MKKPRQDNQGEKYCPLFHLFKCVISKRYNLDQTSILSHDKRNHSSWHNGEVCRSHSRFNIQSFLLNSAVLFCQCIAKTNWKILKSPQHIFADVLNTWILNFEGCLYIFIDVIYVYIYIFIDIIYIYIYITLTCFCEIWALFVSWIIYDHLYIYIHIYIYIYIYIYII